MPSGGEFALDIFRVNADEDKGEFKNKLKELNSTLPYVNKWFPSGYRDKSISKFGKREYEALIISSLENKRKEILIFLDDFDQKSSVIKEKLKDIFDVDQIFKKLGAKVGDSLYGQDISLNKAFEGSTSFFSSEYFSALLEIIKIQKENPEIIKLKRIVQSFIELLISAVGEDFLHNINDSIFEKKPEDIDIFDDFCGYFKLDYKNITGLDIILQEYKIEVSADSSEIEKITHFALKLLESIFAVSLDYQNLVDSYYRYLFTPKTDWAKFCKISIFLHTVRRYIIKDNEENIKKIKSMDGYYHDLKLLNEEYDIHAVGSANYNKFIEEILDLDDIFYLNGSVDDYYDPYKNKILDLDEVKNSKHLLVPFLFTQSGIKPLTSISMSRRYVELYDKYKECDIICVIGFGFNMDDGHINGLFRSLIEDEGIKVVVLSYQNKDIFLKDKLRIEDDSKLHQILIDNNRQENGEKWYEAIKKYIEI